jgi:hypothetical protein
LPPAGVKRGGKPVDNLSLNEVYQRHEFVMEIEGIESPNITKVSGLGKGEMEAIEKPSGSTASLKRSIRAL